MGASLAGEAVLVDGAATPRRGEVWAFVDPDGQVLVHRCRRIGGQRYWFRGDANIVGDRPVPRAHLVGRVVAVRDAAGRWRRLGTGDRLRGLLRVAGWHLRTLVRRVVWRG